MIFALKVVWNWIFGGSFWVEFENYMHWNVNFRLNLIINCWIIFTLFIENCSKSSRNVAEINMYQKAISNIFMCLRYHSSFTPAHTHIYAHHTLTPLNNHIYANTTLHSFKYLIRGSTKTNPPNGIFNMSRIFSCQECWW